MPGTTDTKKAKVPLGSFIMNYGSSRMYPELEPLARMFSADKDDMSKSQNVILTNGEIYFPPDAVEAIGVEKLEYMNNKSKDGAHDAIDKEMAMNLLKSIKPMYGGGNVMPMGTGGMLDNYAGGGSIMDQYGHGGKVKKNLKPAPKDNPGLAKLPETVRNKMGYMQDGGEVERMQGYQNGGLSTLLSMISPKRRMQKAYEELVPQDMLPVVEKASTLPDSFFYVPPEESGYIDLEEVERKNAIRRMLQGRPPQPQESKNDLAPFKEGGMIGPPLPPEMMGQAMNQRLSDSIDMRMQNPQAGEIGIAREQASALQDSINMNTVDSARKSLQLIKLQSLLNNPDMSTQQFTQGEFAVPSEEADLITKMVSMSRDAANARALDMMRMSMGSMSQPRDSMNGKVIEYMPYYSK